MEKDCHEKDNFMFDCQTDAEAQISQPETHCSFLQKLGFFFRNRQIWGFIVSVAVMAMISLAFFYPDNVNHNDLRQHDMLQGIANGQEIKAYEEFTGHESRWTNNLFSGMPTFQISPSYPSDSLFKWITSVYGLGLPSPSNLLFMMMVGFMILMMTLKIRWEYGLIGAIAWGFSTYFIIIIGAGHIWKFVTLAYIPPTIGGILLAYRGKYLAGGALAAIFAMMQLCSNHIQMTYYFLFVIITISIAYLVACIRKRKTAQWVKATVTLAIAATLAVCANLPNLYHTAKYAKETQRGAAELVDNGTEATGGLDKDYITQYSYGRSETFSLIIPNVKGGASAKPVKGQMTAMQLSDLDGAKEYSSDPYVSTYLQYSSQYFGEPEGTNGPVYVGAIIFALFLLGCVIVRGPLKWALLAITILSILLAWGRNMMPLTDLFIDIVPMYSKFRTPESILVIAEFTIPVLAIMGLYRFLTDREYIAVNSSKAFVCFGIVGTICLFGLVFPAIFGSGVDMARESYTSQQFGAMLSQQGYDAATVRMVSIDNPAVYNAVKDLHLSMVRADCLRSLIFIVLAASIILLTRLFPTIMAKRGLAVASIGLLVFIDLYSVNKRYLSSESFCRRPIVAQSESIPMTDIDRLILEDNDPNYRVLDIDRFQSADPSYYHKMLGGYHAAKLGRYQDLINRGLIFSENVMNMLNARYVVYQGEVMDNSPAALGNAWFVDKLDYVNSADEEIAALENLDTSTSAIADSKFMDILGHAAPKADGDSIWLTSYAPDRLTYHSVNNSEAIAVFSEIYFPWGWKVTVNGQPATLGRANYVLRALRLPPGENDITMTFDPDSVKTTVTVATIAVILIYLWAIAAIVLNGKICRSCRRQA